jgi:small-conductance mechanosensitive channel
MPAILEQESLMPMTQSMQRGWAPVAMRWLLALCCTLLASAALAQQPAAAAGGATPEATVALYNRPIAVFRATFLGLSPAERAERTQRAIADLLDRGGPGQVTVQKEPQGSVLLIDGGLALILTPQDVDALRGETLDSATRTAAAALSRVIDDKKEERDRRRVLTAIGVSLLATLVFAVAMRLLGRLRAALWRRASALMDRAHLSETPLGQATRFRIGAQWIMRGIGWLLAVVLTYEWAVFVLLQFPRTRAAGEQLGGFVLQILGRLGAGALDALPDLAVAVVIFFLARVVVAVLGSYFEHVEASQDTSGWMPSDLARPTRRVVNVLVWIVAVVMAYPYLPGAHSEAFKGMSVFIGLMITLGGSSLVGQGASGLILMYSRTLRIGDYVRINGEEGTVVDLAMFTTRIHTGMGHEVTLPNAVVMSSVTRNFSRASVAQNTLIDTAVTIGYDVPWREVHAILLEAATRTPGVVGAPKPWVAQTALSDFYIEYQLIAQMDATRPEKRLHVLTTLNANVVDVFNEHGVQIMSPHYLGDPQQPKVVDPANAYAAPRKG